MLFDADEPPIPKRIADSFLIRKDRDSVWVGFGGDTTISFAFSPEEIPTLANELENQARDHTIVRYRGWDIGNLTAIKAVYALRRS